MTEDLFRTEIERMHRLRASLAELDAAERAAFVRDLIESGAGSADDWVLCARDAQLPPPGDWSIWLLLAGRGFGKTHALSQCVHTAIRAGVERINYVGPTASDWYDVSLFGPSGIMRTMVRCQSGCRQNAVSSGRQAKTVAFTRARNLSNYAVRKARWC